MVKSSIAESICSRSRCDITLSDSKRTERMKVVVHVRLSLFLSLELFGPVLVSVKTFNEHLCFRVGLSRRHVELGLQPEEMLFVSRDASAPLPDQPLKELSGSAQCACQY